MFDRIPESGFNSCTVESKALIFKKIIEKAGNIIIEIDGNLLITYVSPLLAELTKKTVSLENKSFYNLFGKQTAGTIRNRITRYLDKQQYFDEVIRIEQSEFVIDGEPVFKASIELYLQLNQDATLLSMIAVLEQPVLNQVIKPNFTKLPCSNCVYMLIVRNLPETVWTTDKEQVINFVSPSVKLLTGYTDEEYLNEPFIEINYFLENEQIKNNFLKRGSDLIANQNLLGNKPQITNFEFRKKNGSTGWYEIKRVLFKGLDEETLGILGFTRDVTDRKRLHDWLDFQEQMFKFLTKRLQIGIVIIDKDLVVIEWNDEQQGITGIESKSAIGQNVGIFEQQLSVTTEKEIDGNNIFTQQLIQVFKNENVGWLGKPKIKTITKPNGNQVIVEITTELSALVPNSYIVIFVHSLENDNKHGNQLPAKQDLELHLLHWQKVMRKAAHTFDEILKGFLPRIGIISNTDYAFVFRYQESNPVDPIATVFIWSSYYTLRTTGKHKLSTFITSPYIKQWITQLRSAEILNLTVNALPLNEKRILQNEGIKSVLAIPLFFDQQFWGFICFERHTLTAKWKNNEIARINLLINLLEIAEIQRRKDLYIFNRYNQLAIVQEQIVDPVLLIEKNGKILHCNIPAASFFYAVDSALLINTNFFNLFDQESQIELSQMIELATNDKSIATKKIIVSLINNLKKDVEITVHVFVYSEPDKVEYLIFLRKVENKPLV